MAIESHARIYRSIALGVVLVTELMYYGCADPYELLLDGNEDSTTIYNHAFVKRADSRAAANSSLGEWAAEMIERTKNFNWMEVPPMFTKFPKPRGFIVQGRRIGVPGHQMYDVLSHKQTWMSTVGSVWEIVVKDPLLWGYLIVYALVLFVAAYFRDSKVFVAEWPSSFLSIISTLCIFTVTFYNANAFSKYGARTQDMFKTNGSVSIISGFSATLVSWNESNAKALARYANAMISLNYLTLSGPIDAMKWRILMHRGVLTQDEVDLLQNAGGNQSTVVFSWAVRIIQAAVAENIIVPHQSDYFINHLGTIRGLSAKQLAYSFLQMPRQYFHLMWLASQTLIWITLVWACLEFGTLMRGDGCGDMYIELHDNDLCEGAAAWLVIQALWLIILVFSLYKVGAYLSDPVGNGTTDYNLSVDLDNLWIESLRLLTTGLRQLPDALASIDADSKS